MSKDELDLAAFAFAVVAFCVVVFAERMFK